MVAKWLGTHGLFQSGHNFHLSVFQSGQVSSHNEWCGVDYLYLSDFFPDTTSTVVPPSVQMVLLQGPVPAPLLFVPFSLAMLYAQDLPFCL